jgi:hypothetical protein
MNIKETLILKHISFAYMYALEKRPVEIVI